MLKTAKYTIILLLFLISLKTSSQEIWYCAQYPKNEVRAVWLATIGGIDWPRTKATDTHNTEKQKQELIEILDKLQQANINIVLLQTRIRGSVIYPSDIEPWDAAITGKNGQAPSYDPLEFAIEECHKRGMELHAWLVSIPLGTVSRQKSYGSKSIMKHHRNLCKVVGGEVFMIPGQNGTADYIANIAKEIVERYDVDGISLDYIRYPESQYKFSDDNLYSSASGISKADWRRENITRIVRRLYDVVKPIKPWVKLSSSPIGKYNNLSRYSSNGWDCFNAVYQDPRKWLRDNIQDMLFPMMYFLGNHYFPFVFDWKENSYGHPIAAGLGIYLLDAKDRNWELNDVRAQMHAARNSEIGGIAFYRSEYLTTNMKGLYETTCEEFFPYPAFTPRMVWSTDTLAPSKPTSLIYKDGVIHWSFSEPMTHGKWQSTYFNVYGSNMYPVDINKAENILTNKITENYFVISGKASKKHYYAVTTIDRFGNESGALQEQISDTLRPSREDIMNAMKRQFVVKVNDKRGKAKKVKVTKVKTPKIKKENKKEPAEIITVDFNKYLK